jgi:uncharacterized membrane protein YqaE (UPF0057 family)
LRRDLRNETVHTNVLLVVLAILFFAQGMLHAQWIGNPEKNTLW